MIAGYPRCGAARDIVAMVAEHGFDTLESPTCCVTAPHTSVPFSPPMEDFYVPDAGNIVAGVKRVLES